jgi:hypothetical protein
MPTVRRCVLGKSSKLARQDVSFEMREHDRGSKMHRWGRGAATHTDYPMLYAKVVILFDNRRGIPLCLTHSLPGISLAEHVARPAKDFHILFGKIPAWRGLYLV